jgi:hypothetical protein
MTASKTFSKLNKTPEKAQSEMPSGVLRSIKYGPKAESAYTNLAVGLL